MRRRRLAAQQKPPQVRLDQLGLLLELPPGDPDHPPTRGLEPAVPCTIDLERVRGRGPRVTVQLDDQALLRPDAVDLEALDHHIGPRKRKTGPDEKVLEALLELAADDSGADAGLCEQGSDGFQPWPAWVAIREVLQRERIGKSEMLGFTKRAAELAASNCSTEVEQCSWNGRGRDCPVRRALVGWQLGPMYLDSRPPTQPAWHGHLHLRAAPHAPQGRGSAMAQNRVRPVRENSRGPTPVPG